MRSPKIDPNPLSGPRKDARDRTIAQAVEAAIKAGKNQAVWMDRSGHYFFAASGAPWEKTIAVAYPDGTVAYKRYGSRSMSASSPHGGQRKLGFHAEARRGAPQRQQRAGSFVVTLSTGQTARFHDMPRAQEWATERLKGQPSGAYAAFYRAAVGPGRSDTGAPWTEPFYLLVVDEYGHVRVGDTRIVAPLPTQHPHRSLSEGHGGYTHKQDATYATVDNVFLNGRKIGRINGPLGGRQGEYYAWSLSSVSSTEHPPFGMSGASGRARSLQAAFNEIMRADKARKERSRR